MGKRLGQDDLRVARHKVNLDPSYLQNPAIKLDADASGALTLTNMHAYPKILTPMLPNTVESIPIGPPSELPDVEPTDPRIRHMVQRLRAALAERPIWTRRALSNHLDILESRLKFALQWVGYMFRSGPWRETVVRFGVDPRTDPRYRIYQTLSFQITSDDADKETKKHWDEERIRYRRLMKGKPRDLQSHLFDGQKVGLDGKVWQVCDITDPVLRRLLGTSNLRSTCDVSLLVVNFSTLF